VSYCTALAEAHTVAHTQIIICVVEMTIFVLGEQSKKKLEAVQVSNNTVKHHIQDLSAGI
jgi:hypothetical protein